MKIGLIMGTLLCCFNSMVFADFSQRDDVSKWLNEAGDLGYSKAQVLTYLEQTKAKPSIVPVLRNAPERKLAWSDYQKRLVRDSRIEQGKLFLKQHEAIFATVEGNTGVDAPIIAAIVGIESSYGNNMGKHSVIRVLSTLSFDYPRRAEFYQRQLAEFFRLCFSHGLNPLEVKGSAAGALGMGQFIPTSYRDFAVDGDGDQKVDLLTSVDDNIASIANYLARHRWHKGGPWLLDAKVPSERSWVSKKAARNGTKWSDWQAREVALGASSHLDDEFNLYEFSTQGDPEYRLGGANFYAITRYNHSLWYSRAVIEIAQGIAAP